MARKTIEVQGLKDWLNTVLDPEQCPNLSADARYMAASVLSHVLMETENYKGFQFRNMVRTFDDEGGEVWTAPDESARRYY